MTNQEIKTVGQTIAAETQIGGNTAERVGGVIEGIGEALDNKDAAVGYYLATMSGSTIYINASSYRLGTGGNLRAKMPAAATTACTLTVGNANAVPLWYNGAAVSADNSWEAGEIVTIFYDGTRFMTSNSQGGGGQFGSGEKIKDILLSQALGDGTGTITSQKGVSDAIFNEIDISSIDSLKTLNDALAPSSSLKPTYYTVTATLSNVKLKVGSMAVISDNMRHVVTEIMATHYTLDDTGTLTNEHSDAEIFFIYRSVKLGGGTLPDPAGTWTKWRYVNSSVWSTAAEKIKYDNTTSGLDATNAQGAIDEISEDIDVSVSGVSSFEQGQIDDSGKDSTASASYYIRTPASSPIPIINGQTMNLAFVYKNSSGTTLTGTTRIYRYLNGTFVSYSQTTETSYSVVCDGTFNQLRVRFYRNNVGSSYPYCSVKHIVEKTLKEVAEQVDTNTADIASIAANLQGISSTVGSMEGQIINKRTFNSSDLGSSYYQLANPYITTASYSIYGGMSLQVKRGDHIILYTNGGWALANIYRKILSKREGNFLTTPAEIDVTEDCVFYANSTTNKSAEKTQFKLIITSNIQAQIEGAVSDLNALVKRAPQFCNNPFPFKGDVLRVLSLGNSFAEDTSAHLEGMMDAAGLDKSKFCYYFTFKSGATLAQYANNYVSGEGYNCIDKSGSYSTTPRAGTYSMPNSSGSLKKIVSQDWDLILLQQASTDAYEWSSYIPYITRLISYIKRDCPKACIGFMLTWATTYTGATHAPSYSQRYEMNVNCAKKVLHEIGINFIVSPGTAIQNARNTSLEDADHLLRDNRHLNTGVGRYVAGCAFFDAVIAPFFGVSIIGNSYTTSAGTPVTDDNKLLCQQCGHAAVANMFEVTTGL